MVKIKRLPSRYTDLRSLRRSRRVFGGSRWARSAGIGSFKIGAFDDFGHFAQGIMSYLQKDMIPVPTGGLRNVLILVRIA